MFSASALPLVPSLTLTPTPHPRPPLKAALLEGEQDTFAALMNQNFDLRRKLYGYTSRNPTHTRGDFLTQRVESDN